MYQFLDSAGSVLYVGKAKSLKSRIAQYRQLKALPPLKQELVQTAHTVICIPVESELEALLLEAELIRSYQPPYNILLKDDKSPLYIVITKDEFPRVLTARRQELAKGKVRGDVFGPYQSAYMARQVLRMVRPAFRWCNDAGRPGRRSDSLSSKRGCFYFHVQQCSGACVGAVSKDEYRAMIHRLGRFLRGQSKQVQRELKQTIMELAAEQRFEEAERLKHQWEMITQLVSERYLLQPDLALTAQSPERRAREWRTVVRALREWLHKPSDWQPRRIEGFDVSNLQGKHAAVSMVVSIDGLISPGQYRLFNIRTKDTPDDYGMMAEALTRRQRHPEWGLPDIVLIDGGIGQVRAVQKIWNWPVPVIGLAKRPDRIVIVPPANEHGIAPTPRLERVESLGSGARVVQQLRDEAHRFAKQQIHRRHRKTTLDDILPQARKKR